MDRQTFYIDPLPTFQDDRFSQWEDLHESKESTQVVVNGEKKKKNMYNSIGKENSRKQANNNTKTDKRHENYRTKHFKEDQNIDFSEQYMKN